MYHLIFHISSCIFSGVHSPKKRDRIHAKKKFKIDLIE